MDLSCPERSCQNEIRCTSDVLGKTSMHNKREIGSGQGETVVWVWHLWKEIKEVRAGGTRERSAALRKFQPGQWGTTEQWVPVSAPTSGRNSLAPNPVHVHCSHVASAWTRAGPESVAAGGCQPPTLLTAALRGSSEWHPSVTTEIPFYLWWFSFLRYMEIITHWITL